MPEAWTNKGIFGTDVSRPSRYAPSVVLVVPLPTSTPVASSTLIFAPSSGAPVAATPDKLGAVEPLGDKVVVVVVAVVDVELLVDELPAVSPPELPPPHPPRKIRPVAIRTTCNLRWASIRICCRVFEDNRIVRILFPLVIFNIAPQACFPGPIQSFKHGRLLISARRKTPGGRGSLGSSRGDLGPKRSQHSFWVSLTCRPANCVPTYRLGMRSAIFIGMGGARMPETGIKLTDDKPLTV